MKTREAIATNRTLTLRELSDLMQQRWDKARYNDFVVGRPAAGAFEDYVMLPATGRSVICVFPRSGKVVLAVMANSAGQQAQLRSLARDTGDMGLSGELRGVAPQALALYAAYLESLLADASLLAGPPRWQRPVPVQPNADGTVENILSLVKIAPPESNGISILALVLGLASLFLFFTGIPAVVLGVTAILVANSVLLKRGYQHKAYTGRFCGIVGLCMSSVVTFILTVGTVVTVLFV
ncbi:hypothetical protein [Curtanaerobium respiraculi]|uniref:hypothetical protein n=1 Tax=Curtanaerobium respiraculi TaxID=2949669 RepID=UPI0024B3549C|nr:hypothetical protein [Curtanaerobium respiraculi]